MALHTYQVLFERWCWRYCEIYQWDYSRWPSNSCRLRLGVSRRKTMGTWKEWWTGEASEFCLFDPIIDLIHVLCVRYGMNIVQTTTQISFSCQLYFIYIIRTIHCLSLWSELSYRNNYQNAFNPNLIPSPIKLRVAEFIVMHFYSRNNPLEIKLLVSMYK